MDKPEKTAPGLVDHSISALNAWLGSYLHKRGNGLAEPLSFVRAGRPIEPEFLPAPQSGSVCLLVHGLMCNEGIFSFVAANGEPTDYAAGLQQALGYAPLYLRYNSGLSIADNGAALAVLLERYAKHHGAAVQSLVLIGHSMGGLLLRSACDHGVRAGLSWPAKVTHVFYLGSPHRGAPLEKLTNLAGQVLNLFDTTATRVIHDVLESRSDGIKDLRNGNLGGRDNLNADQSLPVPPWLPDAEHHCCVGQAFADINLLGDGVVWPLSAAGGPAEHSTEQIPVHVHVMRGLNHMALSRHPAVMELIERTLREAEHG